MISIQTNVNSLNAQENLNINNEFQSKTIQQLSSGYRINSSGDDAAGLAVANGYQAQVAELNQGVINANNGLSQLQIIDGGLSNISTILDRLKTLASESASSTFTGSRATLNQEYQTDLTEITRQASNVNLNSGGSFNTNLSTYVGGASTAANGTVSVDLSGTAGAVDAASLGLSITNVLEGGVGISANTVRLDAPAATFVVGTAGTDDQTFNFNLYGGSSGATSVSAVVSASAGGTSQAGVLSSLNGQLSKYGINASVDQNGLLSFSGSTAFTVTDGKAAVSTGTQLLTSNTQGTAENTSNYIVDGPASYTTGTANTLTFQTTQGTSSVSLLAADTLASAITKINSQTAGVGVYAVVNAAGTGISLQSSESFSVNESAAGMFAAAGNHTAVAPVVGHTSNALASITAIDAAIANLGSVQGKVGAGENLLQYATTLASTQITNYSAAEAQLKDADIAAAAANLTKSQVLTQTAVAALAQANSAPQAILKLLQ